MDGRWGAELERGFSFPYGVGSDTVYRAGCSSCTWRMNQYSRAQTESYRKSYAQGGRSSPAGFSPFSGVSFFSLLQNVTAAMALSLTTEGCKGLHLQNQRFCLS